MKLSLEADLQSCPDGLQVPVTGDVGLVSDEAGEAALLGGEAGPDDGAGTGESGTGADEGRAVGGGEGLAGSACRGVVAIAELGRRGDHHAAALGEGMREP